MGKSAINPAVVGKHSTDIAALKNDLGIVEDGDTATHTIAQGQYVIWQGALYTADAAIASGTTLAASGGNKNLTAVDNGGLNALNSKLPHYYDKGGVIDVNGTYQIPDFANHELFTIVCRRYGYANSVTLPREPIIDNAVQHCVIPKTSGLSEDNKTEISISTTGLITVLSTNAPVFMHVIIQ